MKMNLPIDDFINFDFGDGNAADAYNDILQN